MPESPKVPTTTHTCNDGKIRPGKGPFGKGADRCNRCFNDYRSKWNARKREERYAKPSISQVGLRRGTEGMALKHGFYRRKLDAEESKLAEMLHREFRQQYSGLDDLADDMLLQHAITNYVKALRKEPENSSSDRMRDTQAAHERAFREAMAALALDRRNRKEESGNSELARSMEAFFGGMKKAAEAKEAVPPVEEAVDAPAQEPPKASDEPPSDTPA